MTLRTLLYMSSSELGDLEVDASVGSIVLTSVKNNAAAHITGALMFSGKHFVQVLEGHTDALDELLCTLRSDSRHSSLKVLHDTAIHDRRFANWTMAFVGPSVFVERQVRRLSANADHRECTRVATWLAELMASSQPAQPSAAPHMA